MWLPLRSRQRARTKAKREDGKGELFEQFYFDDWMYLLDADRLINRAEISKIRYFAGRGDPLYRAAALTADATNGS